MTTPGSATRYDVSWRRRNIAAGLVECAIFAAALLAGQESRPLAVGREIPLWGERISAATERINPNTASAGSLQRLPGIGLARAESIIAYRQMHGPVAFRSPEDLDNIWGIGPAIVRNIAKDLAFDQPAGQAAPTTARAGAQSMPVAPLNPPPGGS
jgi:competence ComEA-like helix-hairpin-helix protein